MRAEPISRIIPQPLSAGGAIMTLTLNPNPAHTDRPATSTASDHHLKAAGHLDQASTCHREAARMMECGEHHAASSQAKLAAEHTAHAARQVIQAGKKSSGLANTNK
jgi:hypothetical protein